MIAPGKDESADDVPMTSLPVNYKYFALAGVPPPLGRSRLINWVKKTLGELIGPFKGGRGSIDVCAPR